MDQHTLELLTQVGGSLAALVVAVKVITKGITKGLAEYNRTTRETVDKAVLNAIEAKVKPIRTDVAALKRKAWGTPRKGADDADES